MKLADKTEACALGNASQPTRLKRIRRSKFERLVAEQSGILTTDAKEAGALAFVARFLVQASLPYRRPVDKSRTDKNGTPEELAYWSKSNGVTTLILQSGAKQSGRIEPRTGRNVLVPIGLPYGAYPRLILAHMTTEVTKTKSPIVTMGENVTDFMEKLGLVPSGGKLGTLKMVREQLYRLLNTTIRVVPCSSNGDRFKNIAVGVEGDTGSELWWKKRAEAQTHLWLPHFQVSEKFYELLSGAVPVDMRAYRSLATSPLAMDLYSLATYRLWSLDAPTLIPWKRLEAQMGGNCTTAKFVENLRRALKQVAVVYPEGKMAAERDGLRMFPSPPSVKQRTA